MRENRTYGSEGGEAGQPAFPTPIGISVRLFTGTEANSRSLVAHAPGPMTSDDDE